MTEASWTPEPSDDKLHDECGVFGVWAPNRDPARMAYFGLRALQHRGQESAGIAVGDGRTVLVRKDLGLVTQVFSEADLAAMPGKVAIGHCRYGTSGAKSWESSQPHLSAIEDVLIDGVTLMDADQGIRLLCRGEGRLDRVTVKNVTGTVGGLGFIVNPWFAGKGGHYGDLYFENIDIRTTRRAYDYRPPFLFAVGGEIDSLTLRQVRCHVGEYGVLPVDIGGAYGTGAVPAPDCPTRIGRLSLGDSVIDDRGAAGGPYIAVKARVDELALHDLRVIRPDGAAPTALIDVTADGAIGRLTCRGVDRDGGVGLLTERGAACVGHIDDPA